MKPDLDNVPEILSSTHAVEFGRRGKGRGLSVLVASAQAPVRLTIARYLQGMGHQLFMARSGRETIEMDSAVMVDVIIVDSPLTDMPLSEMLLAVRERRRFMRDIVDSNLVPFIVISSQEPAAASALSQLGVVAALRKPLNLKALGLCVHKVLRGELSAERDGLVHLCVLDPEPRALAFFGRLLQADDVVVHEVKDRFDLIGQANVPPIDILIAEVMGLGENPVAGLEQLIQQCPKAVVLVCTALHDPQMHAAMRQLGVKEIVTKPIDPVNLRALVRVCVAGCQHG